MDDRYPAADFDDWAETYDDSILDDRFPFLGYYEVLARTATLAEPSPGMKVLDLGTGTGNLAALLSTFGCDLWCTDFSPRMLSKARKKIPQAHFTLHDLCDPLPVKFHPTYDRIVSAYVFHHFELSEKVRILKDLLPYLREGGKVVIADIAFEDQKAMDVMKFSAGSDWEDEFYWVAEESIPALKEGGMETLYEQISPCAGVFSLSSIGITFDAS